MKRAMHARIRSRLGGSPGSTPADCRPRRPACRLCAGWAGAEAHPASRPARPASPQSSQCTRRRRARTDSAQPAAQTVMQPASVAAAHASLSAVRSTSGHRPSRAVEPRPGRRCCAQRTAVGPPRRVILVAQNEQVYYRTQVRTWGAEMTVKVLADYRGRRGPAVGVRASSRCFATGLSNDSNRTSVAAPAGSMRPRRFRRPPATCWPTPAEVWAGPFGRPTPPIVTRPHISPRCGRRRPCWRRVPARSAGAGGVPGS